LARDSFSARILSRRLTANSITLGCLNSRTFDIPGNTSAKLRQVTQQKCQVENLINAFRPLIDSTDQTANAIAG
jgi:hypothetical protein